MTSATGVPVSACFRAKAICSLVYLDFFMFQPGHEGRGLPVPMRHAGAQALAASAAAMTPRHVGRCPGLVDEDQPLGIEIELAIEPRLALLQDVGAILLGGVRRLYGWPTDLPLV